MNLPRHFQFSQSNLQDFVDCRRRFYLKHILRLAWPAIEAEPVLENERAIDLGQHFHHLVHQFILGIPLDQISIPESDHELAAWWQNFHDARSNESCLHEAWLPTTHRFPEIILTGYIGDIRAVAKIDLLAVQRDGSFQIYDWKTTQHLPRRNWLAERLQTRIYPYLLAQAGNFLNEGRPIHPNQIEMTYWFPSAPQDVIRFSYSQEQFHADQSFLRSLLETLQRLDDGEFTMTNDEHRCKYCVYRSLCNRGIGAGNVVQSGDVYSFEEYDVVDFDLNQVDEIAF
jgi:RecB family exonuclease